MKTTCILFCFVLFLRDTDPVKTIRHISEDCQKMKTVQCLHFRFYLKFHEMIMHQRTDKILRFTFVYKYSR